jgi:pyruvate dehydrogenase E1 component alpha subunit
MSALSIEEKREALLLMLRTRIFEQHCLKYYNAGRIGGWLILSIGQESVAVAVRMAMKPGDHSICGTRGIHHALASGLSMRQIMAELFGKATGANAGKAGNHGLYHPAGHFWGLYPICAAQTPIAAGLAFQMKYQNTGGVAFCMLGEGAVNQGVFHETLNLSQLFGLPVLFLIENNKYAMGTSERRSSAFRDCLARRAEAYDMEWQCIDEGHDLPTLHHHIALAAEKVRSTQKPFLLEVRTYRYYGFTVSDANAKKYRTPEEIEWHRDNRDPVKFLEAQLLAENAITVDEIEAMKEDARVEALDAVHFADHSLSPTIEDVTKHVYWELDHQTAAASHGVHLFE